MFANGFNSRDPCERRVRHCSLQPRERSSLVGQCMIIMGWEVKCKTIEDNTWWDNLASAHSPWVLQGGLAQGPLRVSVGPIEPIWWVSGGALSITVYLTRPCNNGWAQPMWLMCRSMLGSHAIQGSPTGQQFGRLNEYITLKGP